jgi:septum formation protein
MTPRTLVLASASPRRRILLEQAGIEVEIAPADVDESYRPGESPEEHVQRLARAKAAAAAGRFPNRVVLGADTVVVMDGRIYGKPENADRAREFLAAFSGRKHDVLTGVSLMRLRPPGEQTWLARSVVHFKSLKPEDLENYCRQVNPLDKAGAYGIQEHGDQIIKRVDGPVSTVIGLPIEEVLAKLRDFRNQNDDG